MRPPEEVARISYKPPADLYVTEVPTRRLAEGAHQDWWTAWHTGRWTAVKGWAMRAGDGNPGLRGPTGKKGGAGSCITCGPSSVTRCVVTTQKVAPPNASRHVASAAAAYIGRREQLEHFPRDQ